MRQQSSKNKRTAALGLWLLPGMESWWKAALKGKRAQEGPPSPRTTSAQSGNGPARCTERDISTREEILLSVRTANKITT